MQASALTMLGFKAFALQFGMAADGVATWPPAFATRAQRHLSVLSAMPEASVTKTQFSTYAAPPREVHRISFDKRQPLVLGEFFHAHISVPSRWIAPGMLLVREKALHPSGSTQVVTIQVQPKATRDDLAEINIPLLFSGPVDLMINASYADNAIEADVAHIFVMDSSYPPLTMWVDESSVDAHGRTIFLDPGSWYQFRPTAVFDNAPGAHLRIADGTAFSLAPGVYDGVAELTSKGKITALKPGDVWVQAHYKGHTALQHIHIDGPTDLQPPKVKLFSDGHSEVHGPRQ